MSTAQISFDDYNFPGPRSPHDQYEVPLALGVSNSSPIYSHGHLDVATSGTPFGRHVTHLPAEPTYPVFLSDHHDQYPTQYQLSNAGISFIDARAPPYSLTCQPPPPRSLYAVPTGWTGVDGFGALYNPAGSASFLQNLQSVIESSHTAQTQHAANVALAAPQTSGPASSSSWTLSGSLDPATGVFQRSVEHPRLRTAQACEKCRIRKAKCSGEHPCKRCITKELHCEYAPERKMRGPNKYKRKNGGPPTKRSGASPGRKASRESTTSSDSESHTSDQSGSSPRMLVSYPSTHSSTHSSPAPVNRVSSLVPQARRPRAATVGSSQRPSDSYSDTFEEPSGTQRANLSVHARPRPPPLDLTETRDFDPRLPAEYTLHIDKPETTVDACDAKHTSLPSYLLQSYTRIALNNSGEGVTEPPSFGSRTQSQNVEGFLHHSPADPLSVYSYSHTSSNSSTPITPLPLAYEAASGLLYAEDTLALDHGFDHFVPATPAENLNHAHDVHVNNDAFHLKDVQQEESIHRGWDAMVLQGQSADDETPRALNDADLKRASEVMIPANAAL